MVEYFYPGRVGGQHARLLSQRSQDRGLRCVFSNQLPLLILINKRSGRMRASCKSGIKTLSFYPS